MIFRRSSGTPQPTLVVLTASEAACLATIVGALTMGLLFGGAVDQFLGWAAVLGAALLVTYLAAVHLVRLDRGLARGLADVSLTFVVYGALTPLIAPLGARAIDEPLRRFEEALFGTTLVQLAQPFVASELTLLFSAIYSIHVPLFIVPAALHWRAGRPERSERLLLTLALAMYVGFVGYAVFPAYGPVGAMTGLRPLGDNPATELVAAYGVALGTFPSLHAGISAAVAIDGWRTSRRWGIVLTVVAVLIWLSTIYLRYHWLLDLLAGLALAAFCTWLSGRVLAAWPRVPVRRPNFEVRPAQTSQIPAEGAAGE
jgi:membrane-associated phospholipid phosphatase